MPNKRFQKFKDGFNHGGYGSFDIDLLASRIHFIANNPKTVGTTYRMIDNLLLGICESADLLFCPMEAIEQYLPVMIEGVFNRHGEKHARNLVNFIDDLFMDMSKDDWLKWRIERLKKVSFAERAKSLVLSMHPHDQLEGVEYFEHFDCAESSMKELKEEIKHEIVLDLSAQPITETSGVNVTNVIHFKAKADQTPLSA